MTKEDYFRAPGRAQALLRGLLEREASLRAARFGVARREFLGGAMGALAALAIAGQATRFRSRAEAQDGFEPPSDDCYAELAARHARFARLDAISAGDFQILQAAADAQRAAVPDTVLNMLRTLSTLYLGFGVSQLTHMTQTASRALRSNASDELVLVALIHDIGELISTFSHTEIVGALARPYVSDANYHILLHHSEFQLKHYGDVVFAATDLRERYRAEPWYADAATFSDAWDQRAFDPDYQNLPLEEFEPLVRETFGRVRAPIVGAQTSCP